MVQAHVCTTQGLLSVLPIWVSRSVPTDKTYNPAGLVPPLFHLGSYNPNKCNSYFANSLVTVFSDPDPKRLLSFQTSCPFSIFLAYSIKTVHIHGPVQRCII